MGLRPASYTRSTKLLTTSDQRSYTKCKVKLNTSPLKSIGLPCSSLI